MYIQFSDAVIFSPCSFKDLIDVHDKQMSGPTLWIYGIHTQSLTLRSLRLHTLIQELRTIAIDEGYNVVPRLVLKPDSIHIQEQIEKYGNEVTYDPCGVSDFDVHQTMFSTEILSNFEKHRAAWQIISKRDANKNDLHLVVEDDSILLPEGSDTWRRVLKSAPKNEWDLLHLGISFESSSAEYCNVRKFLKVLPSKDAYLITQNAALRLYNGLIMDKIRFTLRVQLSYYIAQHSDFKVYCPRNKCCIDGSKIGLVPSSVHVNNILSFNNEFIVMIRALNSPTVEKDMKSATSAYKVIEHLNSSEAHYVMGKLEEKVGHDAIAISYFERAFNSIKENQGILNGRSELITSMIAYYARNQPDVDECMKLPSKYSVVTVA